VFAHEVSFFRAQVYWCYFSLPRRCHAVDISFSLLVLILLCTPAWLADAWHQTLAHTCWFSIWCNNDDAQTIQCVGTHTPSRYSVLYQQQERRPRVAHECTNYCRMPRNAPGTNMFEKSAVYLCSPGMSPANLILLPVINCVWYHSLIFSTPCLDFSVSSLLSSCSILLCMQCGAVKYLAAPEYFNKGCGFNNSE